MTTHVALTSRALGADGFVYSGDKDENLESTITGVTKRWGGEFKINYTDKISETVKKWNGIKVHLTMYGENHNQTIHDIKNHEDEDILIIVGGAKVPRYIYSLVDFNTSIGWQPHSEVAAISIFLYELLGSKNLYHQYDGAEISIEKGNSKSSRSERFS
ncbi:MAG: tRNA (cytidine(56)-2'-O)-methyltransferase [Candidatus Kariarchaeaceae archaeon]|jgi:tRNA (cytidine56-2'-O)-methyltransferase